MDEEVEAKPEVDEFGNRFDAPDEEVPVSTERQLIEQVLLSVYDATDSNWSIVMKVLNDLQTKSVDEMTPLSEAAARMWVQVETLLFGDYQDD